MNDSFGLLCFTDHLAAAELVEVAQECERTGVGSLWIPELFGREPLATAGFVIAKTSRIGVATGIANVYARDAIAAAQARRTLAELSGGRFTLGLGVSHPPIAALRGHEWIPPVKKLRAYLDALARAELQSPAPAAPAPVLIAGHGPKLLALAAEKADGAHTYLVTPEHSKRARGILGPEKSLRVVLPYIGEADPERAHAAARAALALYLPFPAYHRLWRTLGFDESDWTGAPSDRLIDSIAAWGTPERIRARAREYLDAGATQVLLSPMQRLRLPSPAFDTLRAVVGAAR
jgi:probable F420-dependent oxidoreductase